jgi:hypothetical protein
MRGEESSRTSCTGVEKTIDDENPLRSHTK